MNKELNPHEWRWRRRRRRRNNGPPPLCPSFTIFRMEEQQREQRPQNAVDDDAHERRILSGHYHSERKLKDMRAAKLRVERELQRAKDRRALEAFRKSYAARALKAFQAGREEAAPPLGLGNFISRARSMPPLCQALKSSSVFPSPYSEKSPFLLGSWQEK